MSIINKQPSSYKERHISVDSARDSGIGENSNLDPIKYESADEVEKEEAEPSADDFLKRAEETPTNLADLRGLWQPKVKKSLVDRLPKDSYYLIPPNRYLFPGAEVYYDPDEKFNSSDESSSDSELENLDGSF